MNSEIAYPAKYDPSKSYVYTRNEIEINSSPEKVWFWLTSATSWPQWYSKVSRVLIINQHSNHLLAGTKFMFKTFGSRIMAAVTEFSPYERLAWTVKGLGIIGYHAWLIIPTTNGCKVITEETQKGWLSKIGKFMVLHRIDKYDRFWLERLKTRAEKDR